MAHIRIDFVLSVFYILENEALETNIELIIDFYKYFKNEYINKFNYLNWNYYNIKKHLTNNACEAYHKFKQINRNKKTLILV